MTAIPTLPGTVNPLRGLHPFAESERDVFLGRDREREGLAGLVTAEGFRAGLLYGETGVGKTSLLRAGLVPHLRDHGVITVLCEDLSRPIESLAYSVAQATGEQPSEDERPVTFLARVVSQALSGQLYLFILDHVEGVLTDEHIVGELGDLFARVVTRSGGRARFLFCCDSENVHLFGSLERRTGSLFPPSSRYELERFPVAEAAAVLEQTLSLAGVDADPRLSYGIAQALGHNGPVLPADLQMAALALRELRLGSPDELARVGGPAELERTWITACAAATGNERSALRVAAELATEPPVPMTADWVATRASIEPGFAYHALQTFADKGVIHALPGPSPEQPPQYVLAHRILTPRIREVAAPARASARRAYELLGSKAEEGRRLSLRELITLRREKLAPATAEEQRVVERSKRFYLLIAGAAAAAPLVLLSIVYISMSGRYYLDSAGGDGGPERVVVRAGRPGLAAFHWMPASPGFGDVVADTGFTRPMVAPGAWDRVASEDLTGDRDGDAYARAGLGVLDPTLAALIDYATTGSERALDQLRSETDTPAQMVELLEALEPIARGGPHEARFIQSALGDASPAVQTSALAVAGAAAQRRDGAYANTLAEALTSSDDELRRLAFSAVRSLPDEQARTLFQNALASSPEQDARRELLAEVTSADGAERPSAASATSVLVNRDIAHATREKARTLLRRAMAATPKEAAGPAAALAAEDRAAPEDRVLAMGLLHEHAPEETYTAIQEDIDGALHAQASVVRAAALPLYARVAPEKAANHLATLLDRELEPDLREATALAWGEVARGSKKKADKGAAQVALEKHLEDDSRRVRAAAARAYGNLGRRVQGDLIDMVEDEPYGVAVGAAHGLVNSVEVGGSTWAAVNGIRRLWKKRGRARRDATRLFARLARTEPGAAYSYLKSASSDRRDPRLHALGVEGLCNGIAAGHKYSRYALRRAADNDSVEVRRLVIQCVVDNPEYQNAAVRVALELADDPDPGIRAEAAKVLSRASADGKANEAVSGALTELADDDARDVRLIAIRALGNLGENAPEGIGQALTRAFDRADETEKLAILETARKTGAGDLVTIAMSDESPLVRISGIDTAIAIGSGVAPAVNAALTDGDPAVRRAALQRLATRREQIDRDDAYKGLSLATRDPDPTIRELALTTLARIGDQERVRARLENDLASRSEVARARAAAATGGMVEQDPKAVIELLEPLLDDPSHDVRRALLSSLAAAYAATNSPEQLTQLMRGAEKDAMRRLVATATFLVLAETEAGREAATSALGELAESGPPMVRMAAKIGQGLITANADGIEFLEVLVP